MDARGYQQYKQQSINSMTPGELLMLLYDELVKRSTLASIALDKEDWPLFESTLDRCTDIVNYLDETLDRQYPISQDLSRMYDFFTYELGRIKVGTRRSWSGCAPCSPTCGTPSGSQRRAAQARSVGHDERRLAGSDGAGAEEIQLSV